MESRSIPNGVPGSHAGNLDFKELVPGTSLYIPVHVPGALLSIGDGHAVQGDGEVNGGALETSPPRSRPLPSQRRRPRALS